MPTRNGSGSNSDSLRSDILSSVRGEERIARLFNSKDFPLTEDSPTSKAYRNIALNVSKFRFKGVPNDAEALKEFENEFPAVLKSLRIVTPDLKPHEALMALANISKEQGNTVRNVEGAKDGQVVYVGDNIKYNAGPKGSGLRQGISTKKDAVVVAQATSADGEKWVKVVSNSKFYIEDGREQSSSVMWVSEKGKFARDGNESYDLGLEGNSKKTPTAEFVSSFFEFHKPVVWKHYD